MIELMTKTSSSLKKIFNKEISAFRRWFGLFEWKSLRSASIPSRWFSITAINTTLTVLAANSGDSTAPQSGDNSRMDLWIALMILSLLGIAATLLYDRRKRVFDR